MVNVLSELKGWDGLSEATRNSVTQEDAAISECLSHERQSRMEIGRHLLNIQKQLPKGMWDQYSRTRLVSRSTVYNYMNEARTAEELPKAVYETAVKMGIHAIDPKKLESNPVPKVLKPESESGQKKIISFLRAVEKRPGRKSGEQHSLPPDADESLKRAVHFAGISFERLTLSDKEKAGWIESFFGMCMTRFGLSQPKTFSPVAIPEEFVVKVGRPAEKKQAA